MLQINLFKLTIGLIILSMYSNSSKEEINNTKYDMTNQKILFHYEYLNHAWGYQHQGWIIDSAGDVHCYKSPKNWQQCDSVGFIDESLLESNLLQTDSVCFTVKKPELAQMISLIEEASRGEELKPQQKRFDSGVQVYKAYMLNTATNKYESVLLKQTGDYLIENKSQAAEELYKWLYSINNEINKLKLKN